MTRRGFDGCEMVNGLTLLWLTCLIPRDPFGAHLGFLISVYAFMGVAIVNHLYPRRFPGLTHVVKALYTVLLWLSVKAWPVLAIPVVVCDLLPLLSPRLQVGETIGALCRLGCIALGFYRLHFNPYVLLFYAALSAVYYHERRQRIRRGRRQDYGWFHHFEHLALILFLVAVNQDLLNLHATYISLVVAPCILFSLFIAFGVGTNLYLTSQPLPRWFDERLQPQFRAKLLGNAHSLKLYNYFFKPFDHALTLRKVRWQDIEQIIETVAVDQPVDQVLGVLSGGAFVAAYVAQRNRIGLVSYVRSSYWSASSFASLLSKIVAHLLDRPVVSAVKLPAELQVAGQVVLLVDDTICTGVTTRSIAEKLYQLGARKVLRYALFCTSPDKADYIGVLSGAPLIWPWGWESD